MKSLLVLLFLALVSAVLCQDPTSSTTQHTHRHHSHSPKPTVEPSEADKYVFHYDGHIHEMIIQKGQTCYLMALTDEQKAKVHDPFAIKGIEATALRLLADTSVQTAMDKSTLDRFSHHDCHKAQNIISLKQN